jgi:hypothetical protein
MKLLSLLLHYCGNPKTMTVTTKGTNAQGQAVDNVTVWEKQ